LGKCATPLRPFVYSEHLYCASQRYLIIAPVLVRPPLDGPFRRAQMARLKWEGLLLVRW